MTLELNNDARSSRHVVVTLNPSLLAMLMREQREGCFFWRTGEDERKRRGSGEGKEEESKQVVGGEEAC